MDNAYEIPHTVIRVDPVRRGRPGRRRLAAASRRRPPVRQRPRRGREDAARPGRRGAADRRHLRGARRRRRQGVCRSTARASSSAIDAQTLKVLWTLRHARRAGELQQRRRAGGDRQVPARRHDGRLLLRARSRHRRAWSARSTAASRSSRRPPPAPTASTSRRSGRRCMPSKPDGDARLDLGLRQGGRQVRRQPLERRGLAQGSARTASPGATISSARATSAWSARPSSCRRAGAPCSWTMPATGPQLRAVGEIPEYAGTEYPGHVRPERRRGRQCLCPVASPRQRRPGRNPAAGRRQGADRFRQGNRDGDPSARPAELRLGERSRQRRLSREARAGPGPVPAHAPARRSRTCSARRPRSARRC